MRWVQRLAPGAACGRTCLQLTCDIKGKGLFAIPPGPSCSAQGEEPSARDWFVSGARVLWDGQDSSGNE